MVRGQSLQKELPISKARVIYSERNGVQGGKPPTITTTTGLAVISKSTFRQGKALGQHFSAHWRSESLD
jgi:hypothetical protein